MIISNFTVSELDYFREHCKFVGDEKFIFELRSMNTSLDVIADMLSMSDDTVEKIYKRVKRKIIKYL